jgi:Flp pilus assembly protein TadG
MPHGFLPATRALWRDERGAALTEFGLIAPALIVLILGLMEVSYNMYAISLVEGAIHKAGRDGTIEGAGTRGLEIDNRVRAIVQDVVPDATITFDRRAYVDYEEVNQPEDFTDVNGDGQCNAGEPFADVNGNGRWDLDRGRIDMGGARDAVLYTVTVSYPRTFKGVSLIGLSEMATVQARTVLRNQPYGPQNKPTTVGNCA